MSSFDAFDLISLWEADPGLPPAGKAARLLELLCPQVFERGLDAVTIGQRDRALLSARCVLFGDDIAAAATCAGCDSALDVALRVPDLLAAAGPGGAAAPASNPGAAAASIEIDGVVYTLRAPTAADAVYVSRTEGGDPRRALLAQCVSRAGDGADLDDRAMDALAVYVEAVDPLFEIRLDVTCGECGASQKVEFDIAAYLWDELRGEAERLLDEVCALARAYGWREADILAMSGERRRRYLERSR